LKRGGKDLTAKDVKDAKEEKFKNLYRRGRREGRVENELNQSQPEPYFLCDLCGLCG
jgi:hypothetical protein